MARQSRCLAKRIFGAGSTKRAPSLPSQRSWEGRKTSLKASFSGRVTATVVSTPHHVRVPQGLIFTYISGHRNPNALVFRDRARVDYL